MQPRKVLRNKPLVEALLELRWMLPQQGDMGFEGDPHYRLLLGRFSDRVQSDYPFHQTLPSSQIPDPMAAYMIQHQFRAGNGTWPLIQIGPGVMTVNETESYIWDNFKPRCEKAVLNLFDSHPAKDQFRVQNLTLRYINAVEVDFGQENVFKFLEEKLKTRIALPSNLFNDGHVKINPTLFNWQVSFPHDDPGGLLTLRFATGQKKGKQALIWETLVQTNRDHIPEMPGGFSTWLSKSHDLTDAWFFKLIEGELEKRFSGE